MKSILDFIAAIHDHPHPGPLPEGEGVTEGSHLPMPPHPPAFGGRPLPHGDSGRENRSCR